MRRAAAVACCTILETELAVSDPAVTVVDASEAPSSPLSELAVSEQEGRSGGGPMPTGGYRGGHALSLASGMRGPGNHAGPGAAQPAALPPDGLPCYPATLPPDGPAMRVLERLLVVAVADEDAAIRHAVLASLTPPFHPSLSVGHVLEILLMALHDTAPLVREEAAQLVGEHAFHGCDHDCTGGGGGPS